MQKTKELYAGKAKTIYTTSNDDEVLMHFRDDTSAFDGVKVAQLARKGYVNNQFNAMIMQHLADAGIPTHFVRSISDTESIVKRLQMFPIECVVRNIATGSICRRLGVEAGIDLNPPTLEFFLKNDALHDPMINESHIRTFGWASDEDVAAMKRLTLKVNDVLRPLFLNAGMLLVDYKLEFGKWNGEILLGDEFTPDGCRIWDKQTRESFDKDRFRKDQGDVIESYEIAARRLGINV